jgi:hypothetical protein
MPLPTGTVTSRDIVKDWLRIGTTNDDADLDDIVEAVDEFVRGLTSVERLAEFLTADGVWPARYRLGAKMLAGRLLRRKNSPEGVATFVGEGVAYVRRVDPDVASLLRLNLPSAG